MATRIDKIIQTNEQHNKENRLIREEFKDFKEEIKAELQKLKIKQ
jgi:hypothetical protein